MKTILIIILVAFITGTFGFTSLSKTPYASYDSNPAPAQTPQGSVDFVVSNADLTVNTYGGFPGHAVYLKVRVHNNTLDNGSCGGSTVRFIINGRVIDEVPFFLNNGEIYQDVSSCYVLPEGEYSYLPANEHVTAQVQAIVDPYNKTLESNEDNNNAASQFNVNGINHAILHGINPGITIDVSGLSVWSTKNDAPDGKISAALSGQTLHLKARLRYTGAANDDDINIKFILNGIVIKDFNKQITRPSTSGYLDVTAEYYVPINSTEPFDFIVLLSNGSQAHIKIPVVRWDIGINTSDLSWSGEVVAVPGKNIYLKALIKNITSRKFPSSSATRIAYRVLIDGTVFYEDSLFLFFDSIYPTIPAYKVPAGRTTPIQYTIIIDPYNQLEESDETNNMATITIPIQNAGSTGPDFSISASDLSYISKPLLPGSHVKLSAAILNNSKVYLSKDLRVLFKINENTISDFKVSKSFLHPLQYCLVTKDWNVPQNLPDNSVFEVVLDPAAEFAGENVSDNQASIILDTYNPDLEVTADCLSWFPADPKAGQNITLYAAVGNNGITPAINCIARFILNGNSVGQSTVPLISGVTGSVASLQWQIPAAPELAPILWETLEGETGKLPLPSGTTKDYKFKVQVDPDNQIEEINEDNNISEEKNLTVYVPYTKGVVYIRIFDEIGNVSGADVELKTASGTTAKALTAEDGWCTFTGVPFGSYTITVKKQEYEDLAHNSKTIEGRLTNYNELELIRKPEFPYFSATASTLEGITALKVDFNCDILDAWRTDSDFIYEWSDWADIISESKSFSYTFVEPKTHQVTLSVHNPDGAIVFTKSFNIKVNPPVISIIDGGRKIVSLGSIFVDNPTKYDIDNDGINQAWEDEAMLSANPYFELDKGETWLKNQSTDKVVNFVRITPYPEDSNQRSVSNTKYILFIYVVAWSRDYGKYVNYTFPEGYPNIFEAHNGDREKVIMAWKVIDDKNLELAWVYTSAHGAETSSHSAVWKAVGETTNTGNVAGVWGGVFTTQPMHGTLEFVNNILKLYASKDKHAIYPTEECGKSVKLVYIPQPILGLPGWPGWFIGEDVGSDGIYQYRFTCYNAGEKDAPLMDDIGYIFPNERIWSGNINHTGNFCGGLGYDEHCPGTIGGYLENENILKEKLN